LSTPASRHATAPGWAATPTAALAPVGLSAPALPLLPLAISSLLFFLLKSEEEEETEIQLIQ